MRVMCKDLRIGDKPEGYRKVTDKSLPFHGYMFIKCEGTPYPYSFKDNAVFVVNREENATRALVEMEAWLGDEVERRETGTGAEVMRMALRHLRRVASDEGIEL